MHSCDEFHIPEPNNRFMNLSLINVFTWSLFIFFILLLFFFYVLGTCINSRVDEICIVVVTNTDFFLDYVRINGTLISKLIISKKVKVSVQVLLFSCMNKWLSISLKKLVLEDKFSLNKQKDGVQINQTNRKGYQNPVLPSQLDNVEKAQLGPQKLIPLIWNQYQRNGLTCSSNSSVNNIFEIS